MSPFALSQAEAPCSVKSHGYADVLAASALLGLQAIEVLDRKWMQITDQISETERFGAPPPRKSMSMSDLAVQMDDPDVHVQIQCSEDEFALRITT